MGVAGKGGVQHTLVLSDTDNDLELVKYMLWLTGLCKKTGRWKKGVRHFRVLHTGDWLNKQNPSPEVLDFFSTLKASAPASCEVVLLMGNHEVEVLQRAAAGVPSRLTRDQLAFIRQQDVLYVSGNILYIHGYPTVKLVTLLLQIQQETNDLNLFNRRVRKAFHEGRYALFRGQEGLELIGDVRRIKSYYAKRSVGMTTNGAQVGQLLHRLNLETVIHGHRPQGMVQKDYEFQDEVAGVRMINNDNQSRMAGVGGIVVDADSYVRFINPKVMHRLGGEKAVRERVRMVLGTHPKAGAAMKRARVAGVRGGLSLS